MKRVYLIVGAVLALAASAGAGPAAPAPVVPPPSDLTDVERRAVALRAAEVEALDRMNTVIRESHLSQERTVGDALPFGSEADITLRAAVRVARIVGEPRRYSDGYTEVDIEIPMFSVVQWVADACAGGDRSKAALEDLKSQGQEGFLRVSGGARATEDTPPALAARLVATPTDVLPEMYPLGWHGVTAAGRVDAARTARIRAYQAMDARIRSLPLRPGHKVDDLVEASPAAKARLAMYVRSLALTGEPRLMPDRIAEVEIAADVRELIAVLKEMRDLGPADATSRTGEFERALMELKSDRLTAVGRGMPDASYLRPWRLEYTPDGTPLPDWAAKALEATGVAGLSPEVDDPAKARLLAARSAKARAVTELESVLQQVKLDDGRTVHERAAKDEAFRKDTEALLQSAKLVSTRVREDGKWEVLMRLPLVRLYEFSRTKSASAK